MEASGSELKRQAEDYTYSAALKKAKRITDLPPPSSFCKARKWEKSQENDPIIFNHRPYSADIPVTLYHEVFAHFQENCTSCLISKDDCNSVIELTMKMTEAFKLEDDRRNQFSEWASDYFELDVTKLALPGPRQEADLWAGFSSGKNTFSLLIGEMKNEIGEGSGCPYIQACASYAKQIGTNANSTIQNGLNPAFIIYIAGPYLGVAGAVFGNDFTMEPLTSMLPLLYLKNAPEMMMVIVRTLVALKLALKELVDYYSTPQVIPDISDLNLQRSAAFPYPCSFKTFDNRNVEFIYSNQLSEGKLLFIVQGQNEEFKDKLMIVKFTRKYCEDAHRYCAEKGIAPECFAFNNLPGGWNIVVMEYLAEYQSLYYILKNDRKNQKKLVQKAKAAARLMHKGGYVHGDFRTSNIMVSNDMEDMKIVDFDWSGRVGEALYPYFMSQDVPWHKDVDCGKPIIVEHDLDLLKRSMEFEPF
ncbi:3297_t:CDS:2 [Paraglomus brasilianum]|uniref:non-specific serine/threonine protein kinase n=1 Tax=Paraglomus brasilianum TaxID=144538 RepID=A0A9N8WIH5_9GLOM|nr:3297_t:CDS:2 [Paraglomus brasilianum]